MCQLIAVNTPDPELTTALLYAGMYEAGEKNADGCGIYSDKMWKSHHSAFRLMNLLPLLRNPKVMDLSSLEGKPVLGHVRYATAGVGAGVKVVSVDNSHPFEGQRFVLFHNGVLVPNAALTKEFPPATGITDSEYFLTQLERIGVPEKDFVTAINETMKNFTGKFAFLIADKQTGERYAIRGSTAPLHICRIALDKEGARPFGYVVQTEKKDLEQTLILGVNLGMAYWELPELHYEITKILELKRETIYRLDENDVTEVGKLIENFTRAAVTTTGAYQGTTTTYTSTAAGRVNNEFARFMNEIGMNLREVNALVCFLFELGSILELSEAQAKFLQSKEFLNILKGRINQRTVPVWEGLRQKRTSHELYTKYKIQFPFIFEDMSVLSQTVTKITKEDKEVENAKATTV